MKKNHRPPTGQASCPLAGLARLSGMTYSLPQGNVPLILPLREWPDHMEFDRLMCERGVKKFLRPIMTSDFPMELLGPNGRGEFVYVEELKPGVRLRMDLQLPHLPPPSRN